MTDSDQLELAAGFEPAELAGWRALVSAVLTKSGTAISDPDAPERALAHTGYDGFEIAPLYTELPAVDTGVPGAPPFVRGSRPAGGLGWDVRQRQLEPDPAAANRAVLAELENGVSSLWLVPQPGASLARILDGVYLDLVSIVLDAGPHTLDAGRQLIELAGSIDRAELRGNLGADPIGWAARTGTTADLNVAVEAAALVADYPNLIPITVDATAYHDAGGSDSDELAISIAAGVAYLRALTNAGHSAEDAFGLLEFRYAVTANQFDSIAKLRAARLLWDRVGELTGLGAGRRGQRQHAVTSAAMMTRRDPWVNLLRTTIGCFAAAVGGAEAITVLPFDSALGLPDDFGRRIARNTQSILHDESSLARVSDPAGGSFYVETITGQLAAVAWEKFTELERAGGLPAALESGLVAELLDRSWQNRRANLDHRRDPITGVSEFAMLDERPITRSALAEPESGGLPVHRYAEAFEAFRDRSDELLAERGRRPVVFLALLGTAAQHSGRAGFARNLLEVGGISPVLGTGDPAELAAAFAASGATVAILCSADKVYAEQAAAAAEALSAAGANQVWIAGKAELATGGIDQAVFVGCDAVARLHSLYELAEASA